MGRSGLPRIRKTTLVCPGCKTEYDSDNKKFCPVDGAKLESKTVTVQRDDLQVANHTSNQPKVVEKLPLESDSIPIGKNVSLKQIDRGFVWGYVWIFLAYLIALGFMVFSLFEAARMEAPEILIICVLFIPTFLSGRGIQLRRRWGINLTFAILVLSVLASIIEMMIGDTIVVYKGIGQIVIAVLWMQYFGKRWQMFH